jgi:glyoxylase-like metal-dependent hydrolase (beta-lactamase superfamily II)
MPTELAAGTQLLETDYAEVSDFPLWLYLVEGDDGSLAILDTGVPSTLERCLRGELAALGKRPADLSLIFNSHGHQDHMGGNANLLAESDAAVAGPLGEAVWVEDHERYWREVWGSPPGLLDRDEERHRRVVDLLCGADTHVDRCLRDGDTIELGRRRLEVILTRGHSPDHLALFEADTGLLFSFDDVQASGTPRLSGRELVAPMYDDPDAYVEGLHRLAQLPFTRLCGSHRPPVDRDEGIAAIDESIAWVDRVEECVEELASRETPLATAEVAAAIGTRLGRYSGLTLQTMHVARAHLARRARAGALEPGWLPLALAEAPA